MSWTHRLLITPVTAALCAALLLAGCSVLPPPGREEPQDDRFAEFTQKVTEELTVKTSLDSVAWRMPALSGTEVHFVGQYRVNEGESRLPEPDRPYWFHAVVSVEPATAHVLADASTTSPDLLPPVHPDLYPYVPHHCTFTTVPAQDANQVLDTGNASLEGEPEWFTLDEVVVSTGCNLVVLTGTGN